MASERNAITATTPSRVALLYPGDRAARDRSDPGESRFAALFDAFAAAHVAAEPAVYHDDFADEVLAQLERVDAVLVWCNPIEGGRRRDRLDGVLRAAADGGVFVSTHPDTIQRLGTKDVLLGTRGLPFGSDVHRIDSLAQLAAELPDRLRTGPRVLKQHRGHSGIGVWRVALAPDGSPAPLVVRHAQRGNTEAFCDLAGLLQRMAPYFEPSGGGHMIDQAWQPGLVHGMVRAYLVEDRVAGFGHQAVNALHPAVPDPGPRLYHGADETPFQPLRRLLEQGGWIDALRRAVGVSPERLPLLWDCDFIPAQAIGSEPASWALCEVNVSSVSPFPPAAIGPLVEATLRRALRRGA
jgi:hypothetical protein